MTAAIREFYDDRIDPIIYCDRIEAMPGPDTADHVHSAAAIAADVEALVTWDRSGFPVDDLADLGLRVVDPDTYLTELLADSPDEVHATIVELARSRTRPPMSTDDLLAALERAGLTRFPQLVRATR